MGQPQGIVALYERARPVESLPGVRRKSCANFAKDRYPSVNRDSQGILKRAMTTRHMSKLQTCPSRGITLVPLMQKLRALPRMAATVPTIEILKVF